MYTSSSVAQYTAHRECISARIGQRARVETVQGERLLGISRDRERESFSCRTTTSRPTMGVQRVTAGPSAYMYLSMSYKYYTLIRMVKSPEALGHSYIYDECASSGARI